jgi:hypothetical protein
MEEKKEPARDASGKARDASTETKYVAPGVPIVRSSTPRPGPLFMPAKTTLPQAPAVPVSDFPAQPPEAPPLPEGGESAEKIAEAQAAQAIPAQGASRVAQLPAGEFLWLFEYALDMDPLQLNRPDRLHGAAFVYGPAFLQGYRLVFEGLDAQGHVLASLATVPEDIPESGVWGVLYRVPRHLTRAPAGEVALLDKVHGPDAFVAHQVSVREPYRQREVACLTYIATRETRQRVEQLPAYEQMPQPAYLRRLLQVARRQKLPASYLVTLERLLPCRTPALASLAAPELDTEPLPVVQAGGNLQSNTADAPAEAADPQVLSAGLLSLARSERWLLAFVCYLALLLLCTLGLAVLQGLAFWPGIFNDAFTPLGVPWYVLLYGLLGGCVSCVISLNRLAGSPPGFVVLTWFLRPFLGALLGAFAYLLLNSGAFLLTSRPVQHFALCAIVGALAGLGEGKLLPGGNRWRRSV